MLEKIAKLLNQAENAGTEAEAAVFMEKAQQLATHYSIDLAKARHITKSKEKTTPVQRDIIIGERSTKGLRTLTDLYLGIAAANDIQCTISHDATRVYAYGFAEDIDVSEALFASLTVQLAKFVEEFKKEGAWKNETVYREGHYRYLDREGKPCSSRRSWDQEWVDGSYQPISWLTARLNFQDGFSSRIRSRLIHAKREEELRIIDEEAERQKRPHLDEDGTFTPEFVSWFADSQGLDLDDLQDTTGTAIEVAELLRNIEDEWTAEILIAYEAALEAQDDVIGTALVLASKRKQVDEFYAPAAKRARGSYRGGHSGATSYGARSAGSSAADRASLGGSRGIANKKEIAS